MLRSVPSVARRGLRWQFRALSATAPSPSDNSSSLLPLVAAAALLAVPCYSITQSEAPNSTTLLNWSGTHAISVQNDKLFEPETVAEVEAIVKHCHEIEQPIRPMGSALSPNAIAFSSRGIISLSNLDRIVEVTEATPGKPATVRVQAGARVAQVVEALRPYGLTLPNLASIAEQQMGGFVQVGAHGTGRCIAPVDHYVKEITLATPALGTITLSEGEEFQLAKVGLGCMGVVVEVVMECIPAHRLVEHTFVLTRQQARERLEELLKQHKHMRYMWIPYADAVVCVTNDPEDTFHTLPSMEPQYSEDQRFAPLRDLLIELTQQADEPASLESLQGVGFGELRDALLAINPLDLEHVRRCNQAEAEFWRRSEGWQIQPSDKLLQFDCGGQQWVWEVCFPTGKQEENDGNDMEFMSRLLRGIEDSGLPAHSPIEQRWSASSSSLMSPAYGSEDGLHSWVGIINYLPTDDDAQRRDITDLFTGRYCDLMRSVGQDLNATSHWAKLEAPKSIYKLIDVKLQLESRFPLKLFNRHRALYDPKNILGNDLLNMTIGFPSEE